MADFIARMKARGQQIERNVNKTVQAVAMAVERQVVVASPVDTGLFCSNWVASLGVPSGGTRSPFAPDKGGSSGAANKGQAIQAANAVIATRQSGQDIWICNSVSYGRSLNAGSSQQAPANFVEQGIQNGLAELKRAKLLE